MFPLGRQLLLQHPQQHCFCKTAADRPSLFLRLWLWWERAHGTEEEEEEEKDGKWRKGEERGAALFAMRSFSSSLPLLLTEGVSSHRRGGESPLLIQAPPASQIY